MNSKKKSIGLLVTPIVAVALFIVIIFTCVVQVFGKDNNMSFAQYKADYYIDSASYKYYMSDNFTLPYRTIVEHNRKSPVYQGLINSWQVATFNLSNVVDFSKKRVGYYEAFLFDILYKGNDPTNISGVLNSGIKATQSSMLKKVADFGSQEYKSFAKDKLSTMTDDELNNLLNGLNDCYEFKQVFGTISDIGKYAQYATDVEDLIYKFSKIVVLSKLSYEYSEVLNYVSDNTTDNSLKVACNELSAICSNAVDNSTIMTILAGDYTATQIGKYLLDEIWDGVVKKLNIYGIAIKTGQAVGKWASSLFFSTDKEIETYYEMNTLYDFEDQLKKAVNHYASKVNSSNTEENAKLFNASYEMLISTFALGCDISVKYSSVTYDSGVVNLFISYVSGNHEKFEKYKETLNNLKKNIEFESNFANDQLYNLYLQDYCQDTSEIINAQPVTIPSDAKSTDQYVSEIEEDVFLTCDIHINKNTTLTENMETYGDLYFEGGTLDLIGHKCTIQGNLYQSGGEMDIDGGKLEVTGDYRIQNSKHIEGTDNYIFSSSSGYLNMSNDSDLVKVKGSFYTQCNNINELTAGTMEIGGDFNQLEGYEYNFNCSGTHKVILNGTGKQNVHFDSTDSSFNTLEIKNTDVRNLTFTNNFDANKLTANGYTITNKLFINSENQGEIKIDTNNMNISADNLKVTYLNGNYNKININSKNVLMDGNVDLSGCELNITGNLYQSSGKMYIDGGKLEVTGDYRIQNSKHIEGTDNYIFSSSSGYLNMSNDSDLVKVKGSFYTQCNNINELTAGTMEIGGDFNQLEGYEYNFNCSGTHKVILNGTGKQNVHFDSTSSKFNILKLTKDKEKDYTFDPDNCWNELYLDTDVKSVSITSPKTMKQCDSTKLLVKVIGINKPSQSVNWKISGNTDENTTINDKGVLTIGLDEKAEKITVTATSVAYNTKSASVEITIYPVESVVDGINVTPSVVSTVCGGKIQFSSHIYGTYNPSQEVIWSLSGNNSTSTKIDSNGLLTIGNDETSKTITVKATSKLDNTKFTTVKVDVLQIKIISTVDNVTVTMETGETKQLKAIVSGTNNPSQNVTWSLSGNNSEKTVITSDGLLTIGKDETSKKIVVKAKSVEDPSKYGEFAINIENTTPNYDVNMDGVVDIKDASLIQKYLTDLASLTDEQTPLADINQDGLVNIKDVTYLQRYLTKVN